LRFLILTLPHPNNLLIKPGEQPSGTNQHRASSQPKSLHTSYALFTPFRQPHKNTRYRDIRRTANEPCLGRKAYVPGNRGIENILLVVLIQLIVISRDDAPRSTVDKLFTFCLHPVNNLKNRDCYG
jgi:hypothetical protein